MDNFLNRKREVVSCARDDSSESDDDANSTIDSEPPSIKKKCPPKRKYYESYLNFGFISTDAGDETRPQCVICSKILANASMKPSKLARHQKTKHSNTVGKPVEFFKHKCEGLKKQTMGFKNFTTLKSSGLKASYEVALRVAKAKKPHTIAEELILPCAIDMAKTVLGEKMANKIRAIPLSNNTLRRRIVDMSADVKKQLIDCLKMSKKFALQLDESTDVADCAILLVFVRFINRADTILQEEFLFSTELPTRTTGNEIFKCLDTFMTESGLEWNNCMGITTDGAAAMTGKHSGVIGLIKNVAPNALSCHCFIHREALAAKELGEELHEVMTNVVKIVNHIKTSGLNVRLFEVLCSEMGADHKHLLYHTEVRWLSRGRVLQRLFELRQEVYVFLLNKNLAMCSYLVNADWLAKLAYLVDIFNYLNDLNVSLQGKDSDLFKHGDKIQAFIKKLALWKVRASQERLDMFPCLTEFILSQENSDDSTTLISIKSTIANHLELLQAKFSVYFPVENIVQMEQYVWIRNPFQADFTKLTLSAANEAQLIDLSCDGAFRDKFSESSLSTFWLNAAAVFSELSDIALSILLPFSTTYLCEAGFSALTAMKIKYRNRLCTDDDMRLCLTCLKPRIDLLVNNMQAHPSH